MKRLNKRKISLAGLLILVAVSGSVIAVFFSTTTYEVRHFEPDGVISPTMIFPGDRVDIYSRRPSDSWKKLISKALVNASNLGEPERVELRITLLERILLMLSGETSFRLTLSTGIDEIVRQGPPAGRIRHAHRESLQIADLSNGSICGNMKKMMGCAPGLTPVFMGVPDNDVVVGRTHLVNLPTELVQATKEINGIIDVQAVRLFSFEFPVLHISVENSPKKTARFLRELERLNLPFTLNVYSSKYSSEDLRPFPRVYNAAVAYSEWRLQRTMITGTFCSSDFIEKFEFHTDAKVHLKNIRVMKDLELKASNKSSLQLVAEFAGLHDWKITICPKGIVLTEQSSDWKCRCRHDERIFERIDVYKRCPHAGAVLLHSCSR